MKRLNHCLQGETPADVVAIRCRPNESYIYWIWFGGGVSWRRKRAEFYDLLIGKSQGIEWRRGSGRTAWTDLGRDGRVDVGGGLAHDRLDLPESDVFDGAVVRHLDGEQSVGSVTEQREGGPNAAARVQETRLINRSSSLLKPAS